MKNKGSTLLGMLFVIVIIGLLFAYFMKGSDDKSPDIKGAEGTEDLGDSSSYLAPDYSYGKIQQYKGSVNKAEDVKNTLNDRYSD